MLKCKETLLFVGFILFFGVVGVGVGGGWWMGWCGGWGVEKMIMLSNVI